MEKWHRKKLENIDDKVFHIGLELKYDINFYLKVVVFLQIVIIAMLMVIAGL